MPRALIAGCGYVGQVVAERLRLRGWDVEGWTRSGSPNELRFPVRAVDVTDLEQVNAHRTDVDVVVQATSTGGGDADVYRRVYLGGARNLSRAFPDARFVFTSSTSVYGQHGGEWVTEESETNPSRETGRVLLEAERTVLDRAGTVLRLGGVYGPGRSALLQKFLQSSGEVEPGDDRYVNTIHRDDAAEGYVVLLQQLVGEPGGRPSGIYNVADNEPMLLSECFHWLRAALPRQDAAGAPTFSRRRGDSNKRVSNARLRATGWAPRYPSFREGMGESVLPASELPKR